MINEQIAMEDWYDRAVVDRDGAKIGKVSDVYLDNETRKPKWALVRTGIFSTLRSVVPITSATASGHDLMVPFDESFVRGAPMVGVDEELSAGDEALLAEYYGLAGRPSPRSSVRATS
jgi:sporulation protein YlmC with PRC-barrel domain